ncbi:hypothetical protein Hdeb2414_s0011g00375831 [Helianthus debilis subsp. tardiflorus]
MMVAAGVGWYYMYQLHLHMLICRSKSEGGRSPGRKVIFKLNQGKAPQNV